jgi:hypothetical protein
VVTETRRRTVRCLSAETSKRLLISSSGYVGYDPSYKSVIVGHEGTNFNKTYVPAIAESTMYTNTDTLRTALRFWKTLSSYQRR